MHTPHLMPRFIAAALLVAIVLVIAYPLAFVATHGLSPVAWPEGPVTPAQWLEHLARLDVHGLASVYLDIFNTRSDAFPAGGAAERLIIGTVAAASAAVVILGGERVQIRRHWTDVHGNARWATVRELGRMKKGVEIGLHPENSRSIRIEIEGNLLTIAPPRTGKTSGLIIPNLAAPKDSQAWQGPAVVIDPKGEVYRAVRRRREELGRQVRCLDPLGIAGGKDRWNPLLHTSPDDILYLQSMAFALLPQAAEASEAGTFYRSCAADLMVAAMLTCIRDGHPDPVAAAKLLLDTDALLERLELERDEASLAARKILSGDERVRSNAESTVRQATQWLLDQRLQAAVQNHTFELSDLSRGDVDLFIVLPADDRKKIIAPYVRWLLADLTASVRKHRPAERIIAFLDEAPVLGRFDAILEGVGELPGYGLSMWTFWQSRYQMIETYGRNGAETLIGTAEMVNFFSLPASQPEELERWSDAIGTYTGIGASTSRDPATGRLTETQSAEPRRLVPATDLSGVLKTRQVVLLNSARYSGRRLLLRRTQAHKDKRFTGLIDEVAPVGPSA